MDPAFVGWITPSQAARRMKVSAQLVGWLCRKGRLEHVVTPLGRLIDPESVEQLVKERETREARKRGR